MFPLSCFRLALSSFAYLQSGASSIAGRIDLLYWAVTLVATFFSAGIFIAIVFFAMKYRRGSKVDRSNPPQHNDLVEITWTVIPLIIALGIFVWATSVYFSSIRVPPNAMEIHVVGKQWMWKLQHPSGRWENNQLHIPAGRPVVLTMTSEDVLHSFFVPAFRVKQDVIPGRYTQLWFTATRPGTYRLFCAEFCGTLHSTMAGLVTVMEPGDYEKWLMAGNVQEAVAAEGERLFIRHGCNGCHGANSSVRAPRLEGIFGKPIPVQIPPPGTPPAALPELLKRLPARTVVVDQRYIHDSILLPELEIAAGFLPIMPTFKNRLTEEEILKLAAYIRSLGADRQAPAASGNISTRLTPEDYEARVGFVPENISGKKAGNQR